MHLYCHCYLVIRQTNVRVCYIVISQTGGFLRSMRVLDKEQIHNRQSSTNSEVRNALNLGSTSIHNGIYNLRREFDSQSQRTLQPMKTNNFKNLFFSVMQLYH